MRIAHTARCKRGDGGTRFPHVHLSRPCDSRTPPDEHRLGARAARPRRVSAGTVTAPLPSPPPAGGRESGSSPQRGEVRRWVQRRMRVGEQPMFTVAVHAPPPHTDGMKIILGRASPSQTLPRGEEMGKPGFPTPLRAGYALPNPRTGWGYGKPGFPIPLLEGCALSHPPAGGGMGNLVSPSNRRASARHPPAAKRSMASPATTSKVGTRAIHAGRASWRSAVTRRV